MKVVNNPKAIVEALKKNQQKFGDENVRIGINSVLGFIHVYGTYAHDLFVDGQYILIVPKGAADYAFDADMVFDCEAGRVIIDRKDLFGDELVPVEASAGA